MKTITTTTRYDEIQIGDLMPNGHEIVAVDRREGPDGRSVIALTEVYYVKMDTRPAHFGFVPCTQDDPARQTRYATFAANWGDETYGEAVERAQYMASLSDHS